MANFQTEREQLTQLENIYKQKQFAAGLLQVETVLQQFPSSFHLKFLKVKFLKELQRPTEALQILQEMYSRFGDNIMILKEIADLHFMQKRISESLIYYNKLLFLDSFNTHAQEKVKEIQNLLQISVAERLVDTKIEVRLDENKPPTMVKAITSPLISFSEQEEPERPVEIKLFPEHEPELNFETESAAELYFKQGLFNESLVIYKKLFEKTGSTDYFLKIKAILMLLRNEKNGLAIAKLQCFLDLLRKRGSKSV